MLNVSQTDTVQKDNVQSIYEKVFSISPTNQYVQSEELARDLYAILILFNKVGNNPFIHEIMERIDPTWKYIDTINSFQDLLECYFHKEI